MVVFGSKGKGYYPDVTIRKFNNTPAINVIDNEFKLKQSTDLYIYIDLSILSDNEYISELKINLDISNYNKYTGSIRLKSIANYDHKNITLYSPSDKGDINEGYLSASIDNESNVTFNITQIANRQLNNEDKTVKIRLKYYGDGEICITSAYDIVKGKIETKQDILSSFNLNQSTYLLYNNSNGYFHIAKQYKFNYGGINLQNFITLTYNKDQSPMEFSLFSHKLQIDQIGEHKYKYTNELGQVFLYYINDEYFENSKEEKKYICLSLNSSFTIDKDNGIYIVKLNNCTYEVDYNNYNIKKISKGSVCLVYNYDNSQKLVSISKGQTNSNNLTPFITIQNDSIICEYKNKKITIVKSSNGVEKIDEYDIGSNGEVCKNSSLEIVYTLNNINKFIIDEYDEYEVNTDDDNNLLITNLITNQAYTFGINQYYYYINDNYGNIQKYYYNTKNEVIYYVKEKNGLVLDKKCYGYRETDRKEETNLFVKNLFKDIEFNHIFKYSDNYSSEYTENDFVCTNPNMFSGLCNQEFIFNLLSSKKERTIESMINLSGNANEIITLTILSKVDLDEEDEYLKAELEVAYVDNEGFKYKTFTMNCKCLDNEYEFNTMKFVTEKRYISIILKIKYNGNNQCRVSNILINKSKSNDKVIRDDYDRVIGFLEGDTTSKVVYNDMESNDIKEYKDNLGNYYDCSYNEQGELLNYINYSNNDCIIKTYNEDNLLDNECTKVDNYETKLTQT